MQVHPVVIASGLLSASILGAAFGPRLLPSQLGNTAIAAEDCVGHAGFYSPSLDTILEQGTYADAFYNEIIESELQQGAHFDVLDFEVVDGRVMFFYASSC